MDRGDLCNESVGLGFLVSEYGIGLIKANARTVRRDNNDAKSVKVLQLLCSGLSCGRHSRELGIRSQEVLQGY